MLRALSNTGWLFADKVVRLGVGLLVGVWIARYLGPEQFGLLNYAVALVAVFGAVASAGLNGIVVRDLVNQPVTANETLGSSLALQLAGGLVAFGLAVLAIGLLRPDDPLARLVVTVLGLTLVFKASDVVRYWFEAHVQSRYVVWVENGVFLLLAAIKVGMILAHASLMAFVWASFAEALLVALGLFALVARRGCQLHAWRARVHRARTLLADSWPLILSGLAVMVYMRIDQIMLGQMLGDEAVGVYSAAVRISEVWYFVPVAILASVFPAIIAAKKHNEALYRRRLQQLYNAMVALALVIALPMSLLAEPVIKLLFGIPYAEAGPVLALHIWTAVFVFLGLASGNGYLAENLQRLTFSRTVLGAVVNVLANLLLIPRYGMLGAALGTLLAQIAAAYLFDSFHPATRSHFRMKTLSFFTFYRLRV